MKLKKLTAASLAALMAVSSLAACGNGGDSTTAAKTDAETTKAEDTTKATEGTDKETDGTDKETETDKETDPVTGEKPTITFMVTDHSGNSLKNDGAEEVIKMFEEYTGIHVDFQWENNDTYGTTFGLALMDKDNSPMILTTGGTITAQIVDAAMKDAFWDLSEFIFDEEAYPNLSQANEDVLKGLTVNGKVIGIYRSRAIGRQGFSYRTDWAEKLGLSEPKTIEDVEEMMRAFTEDDPDGNGVDDTFGLALSKYTGPFDIMQTWFGVGNEWVEQDGKLVPVHQTEEYAEALEWFKKIYDAGYVRPDWATIDSGTWADQVNKGEAGIWIDMMDGARRNWDYFEKNEVASVVDESTNATMTFVGPIEGKTLATSGYNGFYMITKAGAKTEEDVKNCLTFLDKMNDNDMRILADYGIEGTTYDLNEDGDIVVRTDIEANQAPHNGLNQTLCYIPFGVITDPTVARTERMILHDESLVRNEAVAVFNPALGYLANSTVNAEVGSDIKTILDNARTNYICGEISKDEFDEEIKAWEERGGLDLIEDINALFEADK